MHDYQILKLWKVQVFFHILLFIVGIFNLSLSVVYSRISTTEATLQYHIIDSTIFQTNSFDFLSEFA